ncbi:MAG: uracil-DNA glycosylase family protein [Anaerolineales bacterium]|nr:uracil-DNA glycosylase family protein [Anaerolineales bacterium]
MQIKECTGCETFPCVDVYHKSYSLPDIEIHPDKVSLILISEAAPEHPGDSYYADGDPSFQQTTLQAFKAAGVGIQSFKELLGMGIYFTTAVKCAKTGYGIKAATIKECSLIMEKELNRFPNVQAYLLMGDVAIKAINYIAKRKGAGRVIPAGSTYKIRGGEFYFGGVRTFPSYLQVGPSFGIEKSKQRMIAEDIAAALSLIA